MVAAQGRAGSGWTANHSRAETKVTNCNAYSIGMAPVIEHKTTFCRICEPLCGMIATVEDGKLTALRPDKDHPLSSGFACQKGIAFTEVQNDPDRVTTPLRRTPTGFEQVTWDEALGDIASRLTGILRRDGSGAVGWYMGNPGAFSYAHTFAALMFIKAVGRHSHYFTASSQDTNSRLIASQLLYGVPTSVPIPDLTRTDLLVMMGANPVVSHGSFLTAPRIKDRMGDIVKRGGRVVVVDPRRTETAAAFEWLGLVPDTDAYLLLSLLAVMFADGLVDRARVSTQADGIDWLRASANRSARRRPQSTPASTPTACDHSPTTWCERRAPRSTAGSARASGATAPLWPTSSTRSTWSRDNLDTPGGSVFGLMQTVGQRWQNTVMGVALRRMYRRRTRVGDFPMPSGRSLRR